MYVIYNSMGIIDLALNALWTLKDNSPPSSIPLVFSIKIATLCFKVILLYLASKYLSIAAKLTHLNSQKQQLSS